VERIYINTFTAFFLAIMISRQCSGLFPKSRKKTL
jgi:hypothetical protein